MAYYVMVVDLENISRPLLRFLQRVQSVFIRLNGFTFTPVYRMLYVAVALDFYNVIRHNLLDV